MLTKEALNERWWSGLPALRQALEDKSLSMGYFGPSSVSDNFFDRFQRSLTISILACDNSAAVCEAAQSKGWGAMHRDLEVLTRELENAGTAMLKQAQRVRELHSHERRKDAGRTGTAI